MRRGVVWFGVEVDVSGGVESDCGRVCVCGVCVASGVRWGGVKSGGVEYSTNRICLQMSPLTVATPHRPTNTSTYTPPSCMELRSAPQFV
jgi:hypothetical protein